MSRMKRGRRADGCRGAGRRRRSPPGRRLRGDGDGDTAREPPVTAPVTGAATPHVSETLGFYSGSPNARRDRRVLRRREEWLGAPIASFTAYGEGSSIGGFRQNATAQFARGSAGPVGGRGRAAAVPARVHDAARVRRRVHRRRRRRETGRAAMGCADRRQASRPFASVRGRAGPRLLPGLRRSTRRPRLRRRRDPARVRARHRRARGGRPGSTTRSSRMRIGRSSTRCERVRRTCVSTSLRSS